MLQFTQNPQEVQVAHFIPQIMHFVGQGFDKHNYYIILQQEYKVILLNTHSSTKSPGKSRGFFYFVLIRLRVVSLTKNFMKFN